MQRVGNTGAWNQEPDAHVILVKELRPSESPYLHRVKDGWRWSSEPDDPEGEMGYEWRGIAIAGNTGGYHVVAVQGSTEDVVNTPSHYAERVPGVECISVTQHFNFNRGNTIKYVWRAGTKGDAAQEIEDLNKARKYLEFEILRLGGEVK